MDVEVRCQKHGFKLRSFHDKIEFIGKVLQFSKHHFAAFQLFVAFHIRKQETTTVISTTTVAKTENGTYIFRLDSLASILFGYSH